MAYTVISKAVYCVFRSRISIDNSQPVDYSSLHA